MKTRCDALVVGAGLAGSAAALLLKRRLPDARVVLVEARRERDARDASLPVSALATRFLLRDLGAGELLARRHLPCDGLYDWFAAEAADRLVGMSVVGGSPPARAFHVDPERLGEELLASAREAGAEVEEGTRATRWEGGWPESRVLLRKGETEFACAARWVIDASGAAAWLAGEESLRLSLDGAAPRIAVARWTELAALDDPRLVGALPSGSQLDALATHRFHFAGACVRVSPQVAGGASVELREPAHAAESTVPGRTALEDYCARVRSLPGTRELLARARLVDGSFTAERPASWTPRARGGRGWLLLGAAGGRVVVPRVDPLERLAQDLAALARLVPDDLAGELGEEELADGLRRHERASRARDAALARELAQGAGARHGEAATCAASRTLEHGNEARRLRARDPLEIAAPSALHGFLLERLDLLARRRGVAAVKARRDHLSGLGPWRAGLAVAHRWSALEAAELRRRLSPEATDTAAAVLSGVGDRAAAARARTRKLLGGTAGADPPRSIE